MALAVRSPPIQTKEMVSLGQQHTLVKRFGEFITSELLRADEGEVGLVWNSAGVWWRGKREIPRRPAESGGGPAGNRTRFAWARCEARPHTPTGEGIHASKETCIAAERDCLAIVAVWSDGCLPRLPTQREARRGLTGPEGSSHPEMRQERDGSDGSPVSVFAVRGGASIPLLLPVPMILDCAGLGEGGGGSGRHGAKRTPAVGVFLRPCISLPLAGEGEMAFGRIVRTRREKEKLACVGKSGRVRWATPHDSARRCQVSLSISLFPPFFHPSVLASGVLGPARRLLQLRFDSRVVRRLGIFVLRARTPPCGRRPVLPRPFTQGSLYREQPILHEQFLYACRLLARHLHAGVARSAMFAPEAAGLGKTNSHDRRPLCCAPLVTLLCASRRVWESAPLARSTESDLSGQQAPNPRLASFTTGVLSSHDLWRIVGNCLADFLPACLPVPCLPLWEYCTYLCRDPRMCYACMSTSVGSVPESDCTTRARQCEPGLIPGGLARDFLMWESCRTMPLVGGFPRKISPPPPVFAFRPAPLSSRFTLIGSPDLDVRTRPNLFAHSPSRQLPGVLLFVPSWSKSCWQITPAGVVLPIHKALLCPVWAPRWWSRVAMETSVHTTRKLIQAPPYCITSGHKTPTARLPPRRSGFNPRPVHSEFLQVGVVPDDATGGRVFPLLLDSSATPYLTSSSTDGSLFIISAISFETYSGEQPRGHEFVARKEDRSISVVIARRIWFNSHDVRRRTRQRLCSRPLPCEQEAGFSRELADICPPPALAAINAVFNDVAIEKRPASSTSYWRDCALRGVVVVKKDKCSEKECHVFLTLVISLLVFYRSELLGSEASHTYIAFGVAIWKDQRTPSHAERTSSTCLLLSSYGATTLALRRRSFYPRIIKVGLRKWKIVTDSRELSVARAYSQTSRSFSTSPFPPRGPTHSRLLAPSPGKPVDDW
ncbi:hypothetical protein PR048_026209 [Dryococelus australis]|uniref:Uncharacterized protein n=1 Tax=Dryococelus australis TaxID=614101 RepID=A0ABQ9GKS7_9NEOP|nr:hypothetical protein PR048_026209 [Dryococelus australis]